MTLDRGLVVRSVGAACVALLLGVAYASPLLAQKTAPVITRDGDRDGVPDIRDRCRDTPAGIVVNATGCVAPAAAPAARQPDVVPGPVVPQPAVVTQARPGAADSAAAARTRAANARADSLRGAMIADSVRRVMSDSLRRAATSDSVRRVATADSLSRTRTDSLRRVAASDSVRRVVARDSIRRHEVADSIRQVAAADSARRVAEARATAAASSLTAGFAILPPGEADDEAHVEFARDVAVRLDSAIVAVIEIFRNTSGAPMAGASGPDVLASREKSRWQRCRLVHFDLETYRFAVDEIAARPVNAQVQRAVGQLRDALTALDAVRECDNISSMIDAPDRWAPWTSNYTSSARAFYANWYRQLRALHDADRAFAQALNSALPPGEGIPPIPSLPPNPPTAGGAVR